MIEGFKLRVHTGPDGSVSDNTKFYCQFVGSICTAAPNRLGNGRWSVGTRQEFTVGAVTRFGRIDKLVLGCLNPDPTDELFVEDVIAKRSIYM